MAITGRCHCGGVTFTAQMLPPISLTACTCSYCAARGALYAYLAPDAFVPDAKTDAVYRWNTRLVEHHFCATCGCATWSDSPAFARDGAWDGVTRRIGLNARLIDGYDADKAIVETIDGRNLW
ncbi:GFA family protein [Dokdonella sp. MW10]|uniref:GFA family protein n=1 Tax=Dokdonella sp. MW10 TaxID=2992926 RepID=UPI003F823A31